MPTYKDFSICTEESSDQASFICHYVGLDGSRKYDIGWYTTSKLKCYPPTDLLRDSETTVRHTWGGRVWKTDTHLHCFHPEGSWSFDCHRSLSWCTVRKDEHGRLWVTGHRLATEILRRLYDSCSLDQALPLINDFAKSVNESSRYYLDGSSAMEVWKHLRTQSWWDQHAEDTMKKVMVDLARKLAHWEDTTYFPRDAHLYRAAAEDTTKWPYCKGGSEPRWAWELKKKCFLLPWGPKKGTFDP